MIDFRARDGRPLDTVSWGRLFQDDAYRQVALTRVGPLVISTVWIGYDRSPWRAVTLADLVVPIAPEIFELLVFVTEPDATWIGPIHFRTEERAVDAHRQIAGCLAGMRAITQGH